MCRLYWYVTTLSFLANQRNCKNFLSSVLTSTWRIISSISAVIADLFSRYLDRMPIKLANRSGPAKSRSLSEVLRNLLFFALKTLLTSSGLWGFNTGWCGTYHTRSSRVKARSSEDKIETYPFRKSDAIVLLFFWVVGCCQAVVLVLEVAPVLTQSCSTKLIDFRSTANQLRIDLHWTSLWSSKNQLPAYLLCSFCQQPSKCRMTPYPTIFWQLLLIWCHPHSQHDKLHHLNGFHTLEVGHWPSNPVEAWLPMVCFLRHFCTPVVDLARRGFDPRWWSTSWGHFFKSLAFQIRVFLLHLFDVVQASANF